MDIDTTPPATHHENRPSMQLDIPPPDQVMMEVDPDVAAGPPGSPQDPPNVSAANSILPNNALSQQWFHAPSPSKNFDYAPSPFRPRSAPPSAIISASDVASWPKLKLDQLFIEWFSRPDSQSWISSLLEDLSSANGKSSSYTLLDIPNRLSRFDRAHSPGRSKSPGHGNRSFSPQQAPSSPVSKLFHTHVPFDDSDCSPHSPPATPVLTSTANSKSALTVQQTATVMELGQSGKLSPIRADNLSADASLPNVNLNNVRSQPQLDASQGDGDVAFSSSGILPAGNAVLDPTIGVISETAPEMRSMEKSHTEGAFPSDQRNLSDAKGQENNNDVAKESAKESPDGCKKAMFNEQSLEHDDENEQVDTSVRTVSNIGTTDVITNGVIENDEASRKETMSSNETAKNPNNVTDPISVSPDASGGLPPTAPRTPTTNDISWQKLSNVAKRKSLPKFYFPCGRDAEAREKKERESLAEFFKGQRSQGKLAGVHRTEIAELVVEVVGLPSYFASIIFSIIVEQFPPRTSDDNMKDVDAGEEGSSSSCVNGMQPNDMATSGEEPWRGNPDTKMVDGDGGGGEMKDVAGSSSDGKIISEKEDEYVTDEQMSAFYKARCGGKSRETRLFQTLLGRARRHYLVPSDFRPLMRALLMCHQGLAFLHATPEFQQRYSETVIERIYFGCTRQHNGRLTLADIKRCKLLNTLMTIDEEEDINRERRYFSYEHFYVLYCRFWELDANHDLQIDKEDLMRYSSHSLTTRIVDRIFSGHARPLDAPQNAGFMSYTDFIWFCLSEEDKTSDTAIDYWFRCVDMDGDGIITMYDMEYFYKEQLHRMESFGHEPVQVKDILCQLLDMISPNMNPPMIRRRDLKKCRLAGNFFNILFNLNKFFTIEARDPLQIRQEHATPQLTDWDRFAALEYLRLSADEDGDEDESWEEVGDAPNPLLAGEAPF